MHEVRQQRQSKKTVGDGSFEGGFAAGALHVNVDPLVVERGISKLLNALLGHVEPAGDGDFLAYEVFERVGGIENSFGHKIQNLPRRHGETAMNAKIAEDRRN